MAIQRRKFTENQKIDILNQAETLGVTAVLRIHSLSYSVFARWKHKYMKQNTNLESYQLNNKTRSELKLLIEENTMLKKIIAQQALEIERKSEELNKSNALHGKR